MQGLSGSAAVGQPWRDDRNAWTVPLQPVSVALNERHWQGGDGPQNARSRLIAGMSPMRIKYRTPDGTITALDLTTRDAAVVVGRDRDLSQLVLADPQVSRAHSSLMVGDDGLVVEDLGSRNGTWLNRVRVTEQVVVGREDVLRVGGTDIWLAGEDDADNELLVGHRVGGYDLMEVLGRGSYGTVYRGLQVALSRSVAIKVLDRKHREDASRVESFLTEARRAGRGIIRMLCRCTMSCRLMAIICW